MSVIAVTAAAADRPASAATAHREASRASGSHAIRRKRVFSGSPYESTIGFCRANRVGDRVLVSGTAPIWPDGNVDPDAAAQARRVFDIIIGALKEAGASAADVVRTRMFIVDAADADAIGRVHGEVFFEARPVSTMVVVTGLLDPRWKLEVEAEAVIED